MKRDSLIDATTGELFVAIPRGAWEAIAELAASLPDPESCNCPACRLVVIVMKLSQQLELSPDIEISSERERELERWIANLREILERE